MTVRSLFGVRRWLAPGVVAAVLFATRAYAYDPISWATVDGGGTIGATGGSYRLSGTIGQHDAGTLTGGAFVLRGGFWRGGSSSTTGAEPSSDVPLAFRFASPAPNPIHSQARLSFDLPKQVRVSVLLFDLSGRQVQRADLGLLPAGRYNHVWAARNADGNPLPDGVYFMRFEAGENVARRKILVLR